MSENVMDVLIAGYLSKQAAVDDYEALAVADIELNGLVVVSKDLQGEVLVEETGDHLVKKGAIGAGGVGLAVGLFAPPLLAATAVGAAIGAGLGKVARSKMKDKIEQNAEETIPLGGAGLIAAFPRESREAVEQTITRAIKQAVGEAEGGKVKALQAALADAQEKMSEAE